MPQIPFSQEGQRLVSGSPVPVASGESQNMLGEAAQGFGKAMFVLGDALDVAAKRSKNEEDKLNVQSAINRLRLSALQEKASRSPRPLSKGTPPDLVRYNSSIRIFSQQWMISRTA